MYVKYKKSVPEIVSYKSLLLWGVNPSLTMTSTIYKWEVTSDCLSYTVSDENTRMWRTWFWTDLYILSFYTKSTFWRKFKEQSFERSVRSHCKTLRSVIMCVFIYFISKFVFMLGYNIMSVLYYKNLLVVHSRYKFTEKYLPQVREKHQIVLVQIVVIKGVSSDFSKLGTDEKYASTK